MHFDMTPIMFFYPLRQNPTLRQAPFAVHYGLIVRGEDWHVLDVLPYSA